MRLFANARVAVLATIGSTGPHLVPVVFALAENRIYTAVDHKPKTTRRLQRLVNIERNPAVALLADEYDDDWSRLWWVRADGDAAVVESGEARTGLAALIEKYPQYQGRTPIGPVIVITPHRWRGWSACSAR